MTLVGVEGAEFEVFCEGVGMLGLLEVIVEVRRGGEREGRGKGRERGCEE